MTKKNISPNEVNPVRTTTFEVVNKSRDVKINLHRLNEVADKLIKRGFKRVFWNFNKHFRTKDEKKLLTYLIVLDSLNFCFWSKKERWKISYNRKNYNGYFALSLCLKDFFEKYPECANFEYFSSISFSEFKSILQGGKNLLFLRKRYEILRQVSRVFMHDYNGDPIRFIKDANHKFSILVPKIAKELPSFNDVACYKTKKVYLLKRAQILVGDIYGAFKGRGIGNFDDLDYLTAFPDYKLPQIFCYFGVFEYSEYLQKKIDSGILIPAFSREEVEIRSATVLAVEYLKEVLLKHGMKFYSFEIDWMLWTKSKELKSLKPHHLTKTIFY